MKTGNKSFIGISIGTLILLSGVSQFAFAQVSAEIPDLFIGHEIVAREPTKDELKRYALNAEVETLWSAIYADPLNGELREQIAKKYNELGNGDIAENEVRRAEALGIDPSRLIGELGKSYLAQGKIAQVFDEVNIEDADRAVHGDVYLVLGEANYRNDDHRNAFLNYYQADILIGDRFELNAPLATLYSDMGEYERAEHHVDKALTLKGRDAQALILKGELVHRRAGAEKSLKYFELANFYVDGDNQIQGKLAAALYGLGKSQEAMVILREILARDSRNAFANFMIATVFAEGNNIRTALRYFNQAGFNAYTDANPALMLWGKLGYATNDYGATVRTLSQYIRNDPDDAQARKLLGAAYLKQDRSSDAVLVLQYLVDHNMADGTALLLLGGAYVGMGDNDKGALYLSKANENDQTRLSNVDQRHLNEYELGHKFGVFLNLSTLLSQGNLADSQFALAGFKALGDGKYDDAFDAAATLVEQNRTGALGYNLLGLSYAGQGLIDNARSNFIRALDLDPDFHQARINLAKIDFDRGDQNSGINNLNYILSKDEGYLPAYELLSAAAMARGDYIRGERYLLTAISAKPNLIDPRVKLINYQILRNKLTPARNHAARMLQQFEGQALSHKMMGKVQLKSERFSVAVEQLEQALTIERQDVEIYQLLSRAYIGNGELVKARAVLKSGLGLVGDRMDLVVRLIEFTKLDHDFKDGYHFIDQLKLDERTRIMAFIYQGDLNLLESRKEDAIKSFKTARKAGASDEVLRDRINAANAIIEPVVEEASVLPGDESEMTARYQNALALYNLGDDEKARLELEEILSGGIPFAEQDAARELLSRLSVR